MRTAFATNNKTIQRSCTVGKNLLKVQNWGQIVYELEIHYINIVQYLAHRNLRRFYTT